jgi:hypothetical protein
MDLTSAVINLLKSPKGRELIESAEAAPIDQRTEWAEERDAARRQWETVGPALQAEEQAALRKLEEAKAEASKIVEQATRPYVAARERTEQARAKCNRIISRAEANLRASCSPRIRQWAHSWRIVGEFLLSMNVTP